MIVVFLRQRPGHEEAIIRDSEDDTINIVCDLLMVSNNNNNNNNDNDNGNDQ